MITPKDRNKARELANGWRHNYCEECVALEMAEWKNEQFKNLVNNVLKSFISGGCLLPEQEAAFRLFAERLTALIEMKLITETY
ncbi:MAG: hypothetical protein J6X18_05025 [Bacteroidales bacterium]|nr:hypothetical protein [Bacteroidales bacterium]